MSDNKSDFICTECTIIREKYFQSRMEVADLLRTVDAWKSSFFELCALSKMKYDNTLRDVKVKLSDKDNA